jgi:iron complex transport system substrate-binding protein
MRIYTLLFALAAGLAISLAACGGDGNNATATATAASSGAVSGPFFDCTAPHPNTTPNAAAFPMTVLDGVGRSVTFTAPPASIASLDGAHTEILYAIGAGGQVSSVDNFSDCPSEASSVPKIDAFNISLEAITAQHPDLVVLGFAYQSDIVAQLEDAGLTVLTLPAPSDISGVYAQIQLLGEVTGHSDDADILVTSMRSHVRTIAAEVAGKTPPSVYHEVDNTYYSAGPGSFIDDLYKTLGAKNIAESSGEAYPQLSAEAIVAANPDVIILADEASGESATTVAARPGWSVIKAVKDHHVYVVDPDIVSRPGPRIIDALLALEADLYPQ